MSTCVAPIPIDDLDYVGYSIDIINMWHINYGWLPITIYWVTMVNSHVGYVPMSWVELCQTLNHTIHNRGQVGKPFGEGVAIFMACYLSQSKDLRLVPLMMNDSSTLRHRLVCNHEIYVHHEVMVFP